MNYTTKVHNILCVDGIRRTLDGPLLRPGKKPPGGWGVQIDFNGQRVELTGTKPTDVYNRVVLLYTTHGQQPPPANVVWLNLNILWVGATSPNFCYTTVADLMAVSGEEYQKRNDPNSGATGPSVWGSRGWNFMGLVLAKDNYSWDHFYGIVEFILDMLNPATNPTIGCIECFRNFSIEVAALRESPKYTRQEARRWLVDTHNKANARLGKKVLSFDEASRVNYWT